MSEDGIEITAMVGEESADALEVPEVDLPPESAGMRITIDWERAELVLGGLMAAYGNNCFPYNQDTVRLPHDHRHLPENLPIGGVEHAMFLWSVCYYMRGGVKSVDAFKLLAKVYEHDPEMFVAEVAAKRSPAEISESLKSFRLGYRYTQIGNFWVENAQRLKERWGGDPRRIFDGVDNYEQCLARIQNDFRGGGFLGFQEKMVSMITYYLMDEDLIEPFVFPLPVDLHVLRVTVANEMIKFENIPPDGNLLSEETLIAMRKLYYEYALKHGVSPLRLCDAVWLLSQSLCGSQPGNITLEPNGRLNRNGRKTVLEPLEIDLNNPNQQRAYERTCAHCPAEASCIWNVPSKYYYVQGILVTRGERDKFPPPPQGVLFETHSLG